MRLQRVTLRQKEQKIDTLSFGQSVGSNLLIRFFPRFAPFAYILVALFSFLLYLNTFPNDYTIDDYRIITRNTHTQKGFAGIPDLLRYHSFHGVPELAEHPYYWRYYRPLSYVTYAIEHGLWGDIAAVSHLINAFLYAVSCVLLWYLCKRYLFPSSSDLPLLIALIFAAHPIHVEAVTNLKGRDEVLSFLLCLGALYYSFVFFEKRKWRYAAWSGVFLFLALLSKEIATSYVVLIPLTLYFFSTVPRNYLIAYGLYLAVVLGVYMLIRHQALGGTSFEVKLEDVLDNRFYASPWHEKYATCFYILLFYIRLLFFPHPLSWDYAFAEIRFYHFNELIVWAALVIHIGLVGYGLLHLKERNPMAFGILYFYGSIFLVSNLVLSIAGFVGERFAYQASLGFAISLALVLSKAFDSAVNLIRYSAVACAIATLVLGGTKTIIRNTEWRNNETILMRDLEAAPKSARVQANVGNLYARRALQGHPLALDSAKKHYLKAMAIYPKANVAAWGLGRLYAFLGIMDSADKYYNYVADWFVFDEAEEVKASKESLAWYYYVKARQKENQAQREKALTYYNKSLRYNPKNAEVWYSKGVYLFEDASPQKPVNLGEVIFCFERAVALNPNKIEYVFNLAGSYFYAGRYDRAKEVAKKVLEIDPKHGGAHEILKAISEL
ncbi:MAG: tetratricopeptide repeat protein [Bacteroidia bacterium]|nr:tetratricopeptide repeat protein [Bacteroidia bacterium]MDW8157605.1 tetratricopeptide repeat protein [Bacteroidia bacterium]